MSDFKKGDTASWDSGEVRRSQPASRPKVRTRKKRRRMNPFLYILLVLLTSALLAGVGWMLACDLCAFNRGAIETATVEVTAEDSLGDVAEKLQEAGLIKYKWFFKLFAAFSNADEKIGIGTYELNTDMDYNALIQGMSNRNATINADTVTVTIPEGYSVRQIVSLLAKYGGVTAQALVDSAMGHVRLLNDCGFDDICLSVKCSHVPTNMAAYTLLSRETDYPLHLGVTEAGTPEMGVLKSAIGIGGLLCQGIGDTLRVSLTADPEEEVRAALDILSAAGLRKTGPDLISCPTCGRTRYDMIPIAREVERRLQGCTKPITVAVMGCAVNGPGEARSADVGIAGGDGEGLLFRKGEVLYKVPQDKLVDALMDEIDKL